MCVCECVLTVRSSTGIPPLKQDELQTAVLDRINHYETSCVFVYNNLLKYIVTSNLTYDRHNILPTIHLYSYIHQVMNRFHYSDRQGCRWL